MKKLSELYNCKLNININDIKTNSKEVKKDDLFVCIKGITSNRHDYIDEAVKNGCSALIVKKDGNYKVPYIKVDDPNKELGQISKKFYGNPQDKLKLIGITGTDGKTTTASIIRNMIGNGECGYIGTNGVYSKNKIIKTENTTPSINEIYKYLNCFTNDKLKYASMEISSEALLYERTDTLELDVAVITNITEDHLNVHKTIKDYIGCKKKIFTLLKKDGVAIVNRDDNHYEEIIKAIDCRVLTYGKNINSDLVILKIDECETKTKYTFKYNNKEYKITTSLLGEFNIYNISAAILTLKALGYKMEDIIKRIENIEIVSGRCEKISFGQDYKIILDYAHTENGLKNILSYLNNIKKGKLITVTGSAGGREKRKRKKMGKVVLNNSDYVIFTMDDPRYENPLDIIKDMIFNSKKTNYTIIEDRTNAITKALSLAKKDDVVLIAGKGRDNYMAVEDKKIKYCDYDVIKNFFEQKNNSQEK